MKETIKNYCIVGFVKQTAEQNWTPIPKETMVSISQEMDLIPYVQQILATKFPYFMFYLEETE